jgi:hypothetical protein
LEILSIDGRIILKWTWTRYLNRIHLLRTGIVTGLCENGNEPTGFTKGGEFFDELNKYQFLKKNFTARTQGSPTNCMFLDLTALNQLHT